MDFRCFVHVYIILVVVLNTCFGLPGKRKLCVEYRISHGHKIANFLGVSHHDSESGCLLQCCRFPKCTAYNYMQNGTCQLLPRIRACSEPEKLGGSFFVHLADCRGDIVWQIDHPNMNASKQCLLWHRTPGGGVICPPEILRGPDNKFCAGLVAEKGLYLSGWYTNGKFRVISEYGTRLYCKAGYFLQVQPNCLHMWQDYTVGDTIPEHAVQASVWKDGTPLYIVAARFWKWYMGYYLPSAKRSFVLADGIESPTHVKILIMKWFSHWWILQVSSFLSFIKKPIVNK